MARSPQSLDDLKSSIEESMAEALQLGDDNPEPVETVPPRETSIQPETRSNADQLVQTCNTTAAEIQATGDARGKAVLTIPHTGGRYRFACALAPHPSRFDVPTATLEIDQDFDPRRVQEEGEVRHLLWGSGPPNWRDLTGSVEQTGRSTAHRCLDVPRRDAVNADAEGCERSSHGLDGVRCEVPGAGGRGGGARRRVQWCGEGVVPGGVDGGGAEDEGGGGEDEAVRMIC